MQKNLTFVLYFLLKQIVKDSFDMKKNSLFLTKFVAVVYALLLAGSLYSQQSIYVIANINATNYLPIQAYSIQGDSIVFQAEYGVAIYGEGAVGLCIDPESGFIFITYESSNKIQLIDATSMTGQGIAIAPSAVDLAGVAYDTTCNHLYTMDRETNKLYSYFWDAANKELTLDYQKFLAGAAAYGIFLDEINGILYVANGYSITYYNTNDWALEGTIDDFIHPGVLNVEKDIENNCLYYGGGFASNYYLTKYDLATGVQSDVFLNNNEGMMGITIDQQTGLIYITVGQEGDFIRVFDKDLNMLYESDDIGDPTDISTNGIAYNPLNFNIRAEFDCVVPGDSLEFSLCYKNSYPNTAKNVIIVAEIPQATTYMSSSDGGIYDSVSATVTWNIGDLPGQTPETCVSLKLLISPNFPISSYLFLNSTINASKIGPMHVGELTLTDTSETCIIPFGFMEGSTSICKGDTAIISITLSGEAPWDVVYSDGSATDTIFNIQNSTYLLKVSPDITTTYSILRIYSGNGMTNTSDGNATVTVNPAPEISLGPDTLLLERGKSVTLSPGTGFNDYLWQDGSTLSSYTTSDTGTFTVKVSDINGCENIDSTHIIYIDMYIPNAFTPNNDSHNDKVFVRGDFFKEIDFKIFNRLGEMVFHTTDQSIGWDGTYKGQEQDMGVFYYYFSGTLFDGRVIERTGNITLIR